uniref:Uncharacterized protein n=1 Tax=Glossina pallidipes TaxID=7398 RepID=A0A1B0AJE4_GLOPL
MNWFVKLLLLLFSLYSLIFSGHCQGFTIKDVNVHLLEDSFRVSLPDEPGIKFVGFNVNVNREFKNFEAGQYTAGVLAATNDAWGFDVKRKLRNNDVVHVWVGVQFENLIYRNRISPIYIINGQASSLPPEMEQLQTTSSAPPTPPSPPKPSSEAQNKNQGCQSTITELPVTKKNLCRGDLIFEDNFDVLLYNNWNPEVRMPREADDSEFVIYNNSLVIDSGILKITARLNPADIRNGAIDLEERCTGSLTHKECSTANRFRSILPPVISGRINTKNNFYFKYGRVEIRAKVPLGDWLYPLLLLEPQNVEYNMHFDYGQMRIAFTRGNRELEWNGSDIGNARLYGGVVLTEATEFRHQSMVNVAINTITDRQQNFGGAFHIYSLTWTPDELILNVDGYEYGRVECNFSPIYNKSIWKRGAKNAPLDKFFYITLGLGAGGHGDFPNDVQKPWQNTAPLAQLKFWEQRGEWIPTWSHPILEVDYVRVYAV